MSKVEYNVEVYDPKKTPWETVSGEIQTIEQSHFGENALPTEYLEYWFGDPANTAVILTGAQSGKVIGFTFAQPAKDAYDTDPDFYIHQLGRRRRRDTAYISDTAIHPDYVGQGLVVPLIGLLEQTLKERGYRYMERDAAVANGYADKIERVYRRQKRILQSSDHVAPGLGQQRFFRIRL